MTIGKQIRKRRKELKMSVDELAKRIGKDHSTIYRYENGEIENLSLELLFPLADALETTPQALLSSIISSNEWLSKRAEEWFDVTGGCEFGDDELKLFQEMAKYLMQNRNSEDDKANLKFLFTLFKQLNK